MDSTLISILACPHTQQKVVLAEDALVAQLNALISEKKLKNRSQKVVEEACEAFLIREDQKWVYPVVKGIPVMLAEEAIDLSQLSS